jgi:hypothetical protein
LSEDDLRRRVQEQLQAALAQERAPLSAADKAQLSWSKQFRQFYKMWMINQPDDVWIFHILSLQSIVSAPAPIQPMMHTLKQAQSSSPKTNSAEQDQEIATAFACGISSTQ